MYFDRLRITVRYPLFRELFRSGRTSTLVRSNTYAWVWGCTLLCTEHIHWSLAVQGDFIFLSSTGLGDSALAPYPGLDYSYLAVHGDRATESPLGQAGLD